jgi:micrococcal nuclease
LKSILLIAAALVSSTAHPEWSDLDICYPGQRNTPEKTCIVDGDTVWLSGTSWRLADFDTPEPNRGNSLCAGGGTEIELELAAAATRRFHDLLNNNEWTFEDKGRDRGGNRGLATLRIDGVDVGDILIAEGLAREWPDGDRFWCD